MSYLRLDRDLQKKWTPKFSGTISRVPLRPLYVARMRELALAKRDAIRLTSGEPDFPTPPHIVDAAKKAPDDGYTHYTSSSGLPEFRAAVSEHLRGGDFRPSQILVTAGAVEGLYLAATAMLGPRDECIIPDPGYTSYEAMVCLAGGTPVAAPVNEKTQNLDAATVEKAITSKTRLLILNSPSNPTGGIIPLKELRAIIRTCAEKGVVVLSDEAYDNIVYDHSLFASVMQVPGMEENTILVNTLSKTYAMTGWRVGYVAARQEIVDALSTLQTYVALSVNAASQKAGVAALRGPQDSIKLMVKEFRVRRDMVVERLNRIRGFRCPVPPGAFYAFPKVEGYGMDSLKLSEYLINEGSVGVYPGIGFGQRGEGRIRLSYASSREDLAEGIRRIDAALSRLTSSGPGR